MKTISNEAFYYLDQMKEIIFIMSSDMTVTFVNDATQKLVNMTSDELIGLPAWELPMWRNNTNIQNEMIFTLGHVFSVEEPKRMEIMAQNHLNDFIELDMYITPIYSKGIVSGLMSTSYNITDLVQTKGTLTKRERQIASFFENSTQGYFFQTLPESAIMPENIDETFVNQVFEAQRLESINGKFFEYLGLPPQDDVHNLNIMKLLNINDTERIAIWKEMMETGISCKKAMLINSTSNDKVVLDLKFVAMIYDKKLFEGNFCIITNITQQYIYERELSFLANKDPLTGLNNRRNFYRLAEQHIKSPYINYCIAMMDIDKFKLINDTYGHDVGDIAIRSAADKIDSIVGENGIVARYGGEEYIILLPMNALSAYDIIEDIRKTIEHYTIHYGSGSIKMTISSGIHEFNCQTQDDLDQAIIFADKALLEAKKTGRNKCIIYKDELHGFKAIDKLTGVYNKNALLYKHQQFHDDLRKSDISYGFIMIDLNALMVNQLEILNQFLKQTAAMLNSILREQDVIGRIDTMCFVVLVNDVNVHVVNNILNRIETSLKKLSDKFDNLITGFCIERYIDDWSIQLDTLYDSIIKSKE